MYADVDLVKEYSPSQWSKKFPDGKACINHHIEFVTKETELSRQKYPKSKLNILYGTSPRESYDVYFKDEEETSKIFIYVHGGCWQMLDKDVSGYCVAPLVDNGHRVIVVDYNLCPEVSLQKITEEIKECVDHILRYARRTGANEISVCGHSAGAHLLAMLLKSDFENHCLIKNYFLISGIYDLRPIWKNPAMDGNGELKLNIQTVESLSPVLLKEFCNNHKPLIHILYGENDSPSFKEQSRVFGKYLEKFEIKVLEKEFSEYDHFKIVEELSRKESDITKYIFKYL
ncbi:AFMID family protein [Megaselia abdita]